MRAHKSPMPRSTRKQTNSLSGARVSPEHPIVTSSRIDEIDPDPDATSSGDGSDPHTAPFLPVALAQDALPDARQDSASVSAWAERVVARVAQKSGPREQGLAEKVVATAARHACDWPVTRTSWRRA